MDQERPFTKTYLTSEEGAEHVRSASLDAFRKWVRRHGVPHFHYGRRLRFLRRDLDEALGNHSTRKGRQFLPPLI